MKRIFGVCTFLFLLLTCCGCELRSGEDLLTAPKPTEEFLALQTELDKELATGAVYAAPVGGANRGFIQLVDLDGDNKDEAIAFFRTSSMSNELNVIVYGKQEDGSYVNLGVVRGVGVAIGEVSYPQLMQNGKRAIQLSWQVTGETVLSLSIAALQNGVVNTLLTTDYTTFLNADLNSNGVQDLLVLKLEAGATDKLATLYTFENGCSIAGTAPLSPDAVSITRLTTGITDGQIAAFVEEKDESGVGQQTDILLYQGNDLHNIAYDSELARAQGTYRSVSVNAADVDGDGELEIPRTVLMEGYPDGSPEALYMFDWYTYRFAGAPEYKLTTFRSAAERWYFIIPDKWREGVYALRGTTAEGVATTTFYEYCPKRKEGDIPLLTVYYLPGANRKEDAKRMEINVLHQNDTALWGAKIPEGARNSSCMVDIENVLRNFRLMPD